MTPSLRERLERRPPGYPHSIGRTLLVYAGLMTTILLASLDQTIVATALPHIASDLGGLSSYSWVFTAFLLCQTITVPVYGKLGDVYGRRPLLLVAIAIFLGASALCGIAQNMPELVIARGLQGVGAGGLIPLVMATTGELVPPRARGRYQALIAAVFGASSILGPACGGLIVDHMSWRWIFFVNLPLGGLALLVVAVTMPKQMARRIHSIDYLGAALLAAASGALLLALVWGGQTYAWTSAEVVGALACATSALGLFVVVERRVAEPILPFALVRDPIVATSATSMTLAAMCMFGTVAFVPLFVQGVIGTSATASGIVLTPLTLGAATATIISGQWASRTGRYRGIAMLGPIVLGTGMALLSRMDVGTTLHEVARNMLITGVGIGLMMQLFVVAAQNAVPLALIGTTTALLQFGRAMGTTLGVTIFGVIVNHELPLEARGRTALTHQLPGPARAQLAAAYHPAFLLGVGAAGVVLVIVYLGLHDRPLRSGFDETELAA